MPHTSGFVPQLDLVNNYIHVFTISFARAGVTENQLFKQSLTALNSDRLPYKVRDSILLYHLPGRKILGFIPFPMVLTLCQKQTSLVKDSNLHRSLYFLRQ